MITEKIYCHELLIHAPYDLLGKIRYLIENGDYILGEIEYANDVAITAYIKYDLLERFQKELTEATNGSVTPEICGELYVDKIE